MRAVAVFPGPREVRVIERPEPARPTGSQVLLRVLEVGVCGTDREIGSFAYGTPPRGADHLILGHEALAQVEEVGSDVTLFHKGDLVVPTVRRPCPHPRCRPCRAGRQDFCVTGDFRERGIKEAHGFMQEWVIEEEDYLVGAPRRLGDVAVLTEPLTVAAKAAEQAHAILDRLPWERPRLRALILGAGPVGLMGAISMVVNHFDTTVYSLEPSTDERAQLTRGTGARYVSGQDVPLEKLRDAVGAVDIIYEAVGISAVAFAALGALGPNGVCIFTGVPALGSARKIDLDTIMRNMVLQNQVLFGTVNASRSAYELALRELEQAMYLFPESVTSVISHQHPIREAPEVVGESSGIKQVIRLATARA